MARELIYPEQFAKARKTADESDLNISLEQQQELAALYEGQCGDFKPGKLVTGTVVSSDSNGVLVNINYKSDGLISRSEFNEFELKELKAGSPIEIILDELENLDGNVILSYEKAKELKAWDVVTKLFEKDKPVEGIVTHKVKGGLNVDIGIPAFLPGSQIDLQRVTDFDQYVGQKITANIIKINKKRGNVIISRRKFMNSIRSESRKHILDKLDEGQVIQGNVKNITNYGAFIDIGGVDGLLHITDMTWGRISHPSELLKIGDPITVKVLSFDKDNEKISLGLKQLSNNPWQALPEDIKEGSRIKGTISSITDYGLFVEVQKGVEGLVHISEISWTDRITNLSKQFAVGQVVDVVVVSLDKENRRMSLSIKQLEMNPWESISEKFKVGQKIKGTISNITDFGLFVQLIPGIDGLVHISDLSWTEHIDHPSDLYQKGGEVEAVILSIDQEKKKISLGVKQLSQDPWDAIEQEYPIGKIVEGEVSKVANFGAFIKLGSGIEGLVHISELSDGNVEKIEDIIKPGEIKKLRVINVNKDERKLGLSLKLEGPIEPAADKKADKPAKKAKAPRAEGEVKDTKEVKEVREAKPAREPREAKEAKESKPKSATASSPSSKGKSALQIALEEHTARQNDDK